MNSKIFINLSILVHIFFSHFNERFKIQSMRSTNFKGNVPHNNDQRKQEHGK